MMAHDHDERREIATAAGLVSSKSLKMGTAAVPASRRHRPRPGRARHRHSKRRRPDGTRNLADGRRGGFWSSVTRFRNACLPRRPCGAATKKGSCPPSDEPRTRERIGRPRQQNCVPPCVVNFFCAWRTPPLSIMVIAGPLARARPLVGLGWTRWPESGACVLTIGPMADSDTGENTARYEFTTRQATSCGRSLRGRGDTLADLISGAGGRDIRGDRSVVKPPGGNEWTITSHPAGRVHNPVAPTVEVAHSALKAPLASFKSLAVDCRLCIIGTGSFVRHRGGGC